MKEGQVDLHLRLPRGLHERLVKLATKEHRSLNGQLIAMLELEAQRREGSDAHS